jgi:mannan endo-1,4-beta-mannosidase
VSTGRAGSGGTSGGSAGRAGGGAANSGGTHKTYYVEDGLLHDACGEQVVLRGVNHPTIYIDRQGSALPQIAMTGANTVRIFWFAKPDVAITEADTVISTAIQNQMLPILEMHDSTCEWSLDEIVAYWTSDAAVKLITKYQAQLIVNIANEPNAPNEQTFKTKYSSIVQTMRSAGIHVPLMIDAGRCGRDYQMLLSGGQAVLDADPEHNVIFSTHLYDALPASEYATAFDKFISAKLPFIVGEFANREPPGCGKAIDYKSLIAAAQQKNVGWLAWSWGDNRANSKWNSDCGEFDMTETFAYDSLTGWGKEVAVTLPDSIQNTAKRPASMATMGQCR